ncbi:MULTISPECIES: hypothetical protein [Trichocoleus]|uniref:tRNA ligase phosphodiesterase domain-containing protein n=1 Tax=Trichocoleus desertorum GB2-A4 TaxID=2933944 RepID=A0ABV0JCJ9_9CYAN|nr:hypothetical protein [Trichocoleus sp. FACHB-46]MBD1864169.1 hypothetical protein [Trichocoleus sp. FACHB-46]
MPKGNLQAVLQTPLLVQPLYSNGKPHHVTLQYKVERKAWKHLEGREFEVVTTHLCWNDRIEAIAVQLPEWVPCCNKHPHITVSWIDGAAPVESNRMLAGQHNALEFNTRVSVRIEFKERRPKWWRFISSLLQKLITD